MRSLVSIKQQSPRRPCDILVANVGPEIAKTAKNCQMCQKCAKLKMFNKEASRLYAELLLCVCWHTEHIWIGPSDIKLLNILILSSRSDPSNLWLQIFCSRYGFFWFVLFLISTVCELFFTKEVLCFTLQDIFISGEVLVLAFLSDLSNLWLDIFCSRYGFFHLFFIYLFIFCNYHRC